MCDGSKIAFTKKEAEAILKAARNSYDQRRKECRIYYCADCNAWHLTSKEQGANVVTPARLKFKKKWLNLLKRSA